MKLVKGDIVVGVQCHNEGIKRQIVKKRKTGYDWKYLDIDEIFRSENSNDPYFEWGWVKVEEGQK